MIVRMLLFRNTTIIHQLLLAQKGLDILRNDSDFKDVDLYNTRKRYAVGKFWILRETYLGVSLK